jgi:uncharacterized protein YaiI (UPF0178 family)
LVPLNQVTNQVTIRAKVWPLSGKLHGGIILFMTIWVDADACPKPVKEILYRAAIRTQCQLTLIANQMLTVPRSPWIQAVQVPTGFDVADNEIVRRVVAGDLVITADIPLSAEVIAKDALVLTPRGENHNAGTIAAALTMRNFMDTLRSSGVDTGGPSAYSANDQRTFARALERYFGGQRKLDPPVNP